MIVRWNLRIKDFFDSRPSVTASAAAADNLDSDLAVAPARAIHHAAAAPADTDVAVATDSIERPPLECNKQFSNCFVIHGLKHVVDNILADCLEEMNLFLAQHGPKTATRVRIFRLYLYQTKQCHAACPIPIPIQGGQIY